MISTIFDYSISENENVLIKASAKSVDTWADGLSIKLPKNFVVSRDVMEEIEKIAVSKLKEEKNNSL